MVKERTVLASMGILPGRKPEVFGRKILDKPDYFYTNAKSIIDAPKKINNVSLLDWAILFPPDAPFLSSTYQLLTDTLTSPQSNLTRKLAAFTLGDILLHQTSLPLNEKTPLIDPRGDKEAISFIRKVASLLESDRPATSESQAIRVALEGVCSAFVTDFGERLWQTDLSRETVQRSFAGLSDLYGYFTSNFSVATAHMQNEEHREQIAGGFSQALRQAIESPFTQELLLQDGLRGAPSALRTAIWMDGMGDSMSEGRGAQQEFVDLQEYFLTHPDIQEGFWSWVMRPRNTSTRTLADQSSFTTVPLEYACSEGFLLQDREVISEFLSTIQIEIRSEEEQVNTLRKLAGWIGIFQTLHPGHENATYLRRSIYQLAREIGQERAIATIRPILEDSTPGMIYLDVNQSARVKTPTSGQTQAGFLATHEELEPIYISKNTIPVRERTEEVVERVEFVKLEKGTITGLEHWPIVQVLSPDGTRELVRHINKLLRAQRVDNELLLDIATSPLPENAPIREKAVILPTFFDEEHPLRDLERVGIVCVQREGDALSVIIDAHKAHVVIEESPLIMLQVSNEFGDFSNTLQSMLQAAVQFSQRAPNEVKSTPKEARLARIREGVIDWNRSKLGYPRVHDGAPEETAFGVVVPITATDVTFLSLGETIAAVRPASGWQPGDKSQRRQRVRERPDEEQTDETPGQPKHSKRKRPPQPLTTGFSPWDRPRRRNPQVAPTPEDPAVVEARVGKIEQIRRAMKPRDEVVPERVDPEEEAYQARVAARREEDERLLREILAVPALPFRRPSHHGIGKRGRRDQ